MAVSDIYLMFILPWVPSGFSGYIYGSIDTRIVFNKILVPPELNINILKMGYMLLFKIQ